MNQLGQEPKEEEIPPDWNEFPDLIINAASTFGQLGDRVYPEIGYVGKDYTNLPIYLELFDIKDKEFFIEVLNILDSRAIKKSSEQLKKEYDKLKRKSRG